MLYSNSDKHLFVFIVEYIFVQPLVAIIKIHKEMFYVWVNIKPSD